MNAAPKVKSAVQLGGTHLGGTAVFLLDPVEYLSPVNFRFLGGLDTETHLAPFDLDDHDADIVPHDDAFAGLAGENQHGATLRYRAERMGEGEKGICLLNRTKDGTRRTRRTRRLPRDANIILIEELQ